ncbi:MAG: alpha/beta hydrolase [Alphaproteobacteria bacterium]|nr:alpha/beta hydrolase [Alphaproteobacteria bacterium]
MVIETPLLFALIAAGLLALAFLLGLAFGHRAQNRIAKDHPPEAEFITIDGTRLHYRRTGRPGKQAVLVLHGATTNLEEPYAALNNALADEDVIWVDRPGLGWSERPEGDWSPQQEAELLIGLLDALEVEQVVLVGHSWGGAIAMRIALDHPERVAGLVLIAAALGAWIGEAAWFNKVTFWPLLGTLITRIIVPLTGGKQLESGAANAFHPEPVPEDYSRRVKMPLLLRRDIWLANASDMRQVNHHLEAQEPRYHEIEHRAIFLAGKGDTVLWSHRHSGVTASRMRQGEVRYLKGAGHNLHHHWPEDIAQAIREVRESAEKSASPS